MPSFSEAESSRFEGASAAETEDELMPMTAAVRRIEESFITIIGVIEFVTAVTLLKTRLAINAEVKTVVDR